MYERRVLGRVTTGRGSKWRSARRPRTADPIPDQVRLVEPPTCPPESNGGLDRILTDLGIDHDVKIYPGVGHGFMNDHDPADVTPLLRLLSRVSGTRYDAGATADARRRIVSFFDRYLAARAPEVS